MKKITLLTIATMAFTLGLASCGGGDNPTPQEDFSFTASLGSGKSALEIGDEDYIAIYTNGAQPGVKRNYTYTVSQSGFYTVDDEGNVLAQAEGKSNCKITEEVSKKTYSFSIEVIPQSPLSDGGYNYASLSGKEAVEQRTEILGKLEKYAMDSHLTGITLFENGGYVKYNPRITKHMPTNNYITGYGFGILSEGDITEKGTIDDTNIDHQLYYHTALTSGVATINAFNNTGSEVSDLSSYITSTYWSTKMNETKDGYDWYPVLAKDKVGGKEYTRPTAIDVNGISELDEAHFTSNPLNVYKTWRIYVKTGKSDGVKYRTAATIRKEFDNLDVKLEDYIFVYQLLLTGANNQVRGLEMASDDSYGIKGAMNYYNRTKNLTDQDRIDEIWDNMIEERKLGIRSGEDTYGEYIELDLVNAIDKFTAMYTLSSGLVSPLPRSFFETIGDGSIINAVKDKYGTFANDPDSDAILKYTLCCGNYYLEEWKTKQIISFKRNDTWFENNDITLSDGSTRKATYPNRYRIKGIVMRYMDISQNAEEIYKQFNNFQVDSTGIPINYIGIEKGQPNVFQTEGDSTFKLNINACTEERWDELNEKLWKNTDKWDVKPWMSNNDFLNGLFFSINRKEFADKRGVNPSINYFANSYLSNPEGLYDIDPSYNNSDAHLNAISNYHKIIKGEDNYGYDLDKAIQCFQNAVNTLVKQGKIQWGTASKPTEITIHIKWMYQTDTKDYGDDIVKYFETAFNNPKVCNNKVKLKVTQDAVTNWEDVYNEWMKKGKFDLAFGAISGNTYSPLNFLEVLKSDNSSGFTLNWGADTSKVDELNPIIYNNQKWSFDALWEVSDHGGIVEAGRPTKSVKNCYIENPKDLVTSKNTPNLYEGFKVRIPVIFTYVPDVKFEIESVQIYVIGYGNFEFTTFDLVYDGEKIVAIDAVCDPTLANEINEQIITTFKLDAETIPEEERETTPFVLSRYYTYYYFEVYYTISIRKDGKWGDPSQSFISVNRTAEEGNE